MAVLKGDRLYGGRRRSGNITNDTDAGVLRRSARRGGTRGDENAHSIDENASHVRETGNASRRCCECSLDGESAHSFRAGILEEENVNIQIFLSPWPRACCFYDSDATLAQDKTYSHIL